jgi:CRP-like cAMP-binding protein/thioredoxin reductase/ferredoxin-like protein FixX
VVTTKPSPDSTSHVDIAIVGGGPAGLAAGARAATLGVSHVVLERGKLANTIFRYQKAKHVMDEPPVLPLRKELGLVFRASSREEVLDGWEKGTDAAGTNLWIGPEFEVVSISGGKGDFTLALKGGRTLHCGAIVLAIGLQGNLRTFGAPGDDLPHVTYQLDDPDEHVDRRIVVVGVGDAGIENALALAPRNEVTVVNRLAEIDRAKAANRSALEAAAKSGQVAYLINSSVKRFEPGCVWLETPSGEVRLEADLVIGRLGAMPPRKFLEAVGIQFPSPNPESVPAVSESYESNVPGIHLVGALAGYPLIKHCLNQGCEVVDFILGRDVVPADEEILRGKLSPIIRQDQRVNDVFAWMREKLPVFRPLTNIQMRELFMEDQSGIVRPAAGEVIYRRNDFSDELYSVLAGGIDVVAPSTDADADTIYRDQKSGEEVRIRLVPGDFFGEGSLISGRRRTADVVAAEGCVLVRTPRRAMNKLIRSVPEVKRAIDEVFVLRKLENALAPRSAGKIPVEDLRALARSAVVETFAPGQALFEQGDVSDGLHLVRRGTVTVSVRTGTRESVVAYLPAGNVVGEMALLSPDGKRTATVRANVLTETIRLPSEAILPFLDAHPALRQSLGELESERVVSNVLRTSDQRSGDLVSFLVQAGAGEATDILLIDESLCVRCDNCEKACADTHGGVSRLDREAGPTFASVHVPTSCRHCENPKCMTDCPVDALRRYPNGEVYIKDNCIGCGNCASNCPYGVIQMAVVDPPPKPSLLVRLLFGWGDGGGGAGHSPDAHKMAVKCDLCHGLPVRERAHTTSCVAACPTGAIVRVHPKTYVDRVLPR